MKNTNYHVFFGGIFSLISIFINAPEIKAQTQANLLTNIQITPTSIVRDKEQPLLSQHQHHSPAMTNEEDFGEPMHDSQTFWLLKVDRLEYQVSDGEDTFNWEIQGWVGGDYERFWVKTEGDAGLENGEGEAELQLLYSRLIAPFWDLQAGLRYDQLYGSDGGQGRAFAVIGFEGLAPYLFEINAHLFVSQEGDISAKFAVEYELLLSQRLILQPEFEMALAAQEVEEFGVGSGLNDIELGLRLRYEFSRQFAPYVGVVWTKKFGDTANFAREEGESVDNLKVVGGVRLLF
jgi:copper resistance protein B